MDVIKINAKLDKEYHNPHHDNGKFKIVSEDWLCLEGTYHRFGIGGIPEGNEGRQVYQGPLVPGPWCFAFGLCSVICDNPKLGTGAQLERKTADGSAHTVRDGSVLEICGNLYRVRVFRREYIALDRIDENGNVIAKYAGDCA